MIVISIQLAPWYHPYEVIRGKEGELIKKEQFKINDWVIIKDDLGTDLGKIIKIEEKTLENVEQENKENKSFILRKANREDLRKIKERNRERTEAIEKCENLIKDKKLPMKLVDALFSFDGSKIIFAFTSPHRVDFRDLVKDLVQQFHKSIRMHQVGARQETGLIGDIGSCGRSLCCLSFLKDLGHVSTEMMFNQQLSQRGAERLSGVCGRLKCCLAFENDFYRKIKEKLPKIGSEIKTDQGRGKVVDWCVLEQSVMVEITKEDKEKIIIKMPLGEK